MKKHKKVLWLGLIFALLFLIAAKLLSLPTSTWASENSNVFLPLLSAGNDSPAPSPTPTEPPDEYVIIGWSDLGMHYYDQDYSVFSILPPDNNILAQVIKIDDPPQIITEGIKVEFSFPDNSESATKTNFWNYEDQLFGVNLTTNVGLSGTRLAGEMEVGTGGAHFIVEGIPLTEFSDGAPSTPAPYQLVNLVVRDATSNEVLANTTIAAPVSSEVNCFGCHKHSSHADILSDHDGASLVAPVLCADCHADPAIDKPGEPARAPLSTALHSTHAGKTTNCYSCHPGTQTQYFRGVMSQDPINQTCADCHGELSSVGSSSRTPWTDLPRCEDCHTDHPENAGKLFKDSIGHGGMYCQSCHNSTHAILPSREANDNLQSIALQGEAGQISECTVCHKTAPSSGGPHSP